MKVIAKKGLKCPMENNPRAYIYDDASVDVPETLYYKRLIADGSLLVIETKKSKEVKDDK